AADTAYICEFIVKSTGSVEFWFNGSTVGKYTAGIPSTDLAVSISCLAGETCLGSLITISNSAPFSIGVIIDDFGEEGIETTYFGELELSKKNVNFEEDVWTLISGDEVTIDYSVTGNEFSAEITDNVKEGYELVYYKDNSDRFNSPASAIPISEVTGNLPYEDDQNNDEYDYCETGEYSTCHGAKIWYVPSNAITNGDLDWSRANEFYYETSLIQYNSDGIITIYDSLGITPSYNLDVTLETGIYNIETLVSPTA
ncbi:hypothetical protein LCGC14_2387010, partial [marine sediment metagenome]